MAERRRTHEGVTRPYAPARFEYRIWGRAFPELPSPDQQPQSREVYLVPAEVDGSNIKLRREALEIKRLLGVRAGLQHWLPALRCVLPLPAAVLEEHLCPELGSAPPPLRRASYDLRQFLAEVASALSGRARGVAGQAAPSFRSRRQPRRAHPRHAWRGHPRERRDRGRALRAGGPRHRRTRAAARPEPRLRDRDPADPHRPGASAADTDLGPDPKPRSPRCAGQA